MESSSLLHMLNDLSLVKKNSMLCLIECFIIIRPVQFAIDMDQQLLVSLYQVIALWFVGLPPPQPSPWMVTVVCGSLFFQKSTTSSFVVHHETKLSTRLLHSSSLPSVMHPTFKVSSVNLWIFHNRELNLKSEGQRVNDRKRDSAVPLDAPVLVTTISNTALELDKQPVS